MPPVYPPKTKTESYEEALSQGPWVEALCIGVDAYQHLPQLQNAVADAAAIANEIQGEGSRCIYLCTCVYTCSRASSVSLFSAPPVPDSLVRIQVFRECHGAVDQNRYPCARTQAARVRWSACSKIFWHPLSAHPRAL